MRGARLAVLLCAVAAAAPGAAQEFMTASVAEKFVAGKQFSYTCFDGTEGSGRIFSDGSAIGTIRPMGRGETRHVRLPAGTLFVQAERVCASLRGLPFQPCFNLVRTSDTGFRGSISGLSFMYCEFERGGMTQLAARRRAPKPELRGILAGAAPGVP
jgi:hypothetical protein